MRKKTVQDYKFIFSGHESFQCRHLWLKKGYDFVKSGKSFNQEDAVVYLGVGKNMVNSIRFWLKAFNIIDLNENITTFGDKLFNDISGFDKYLEDEATHWLLHYHLVKTAYASSYSILFNELRKLKIEFSKEHFTDYVKRKSIEKEFSINENTVNDDFDVLVKLYYNKDYNAKDIEDSFSGLLAELQLIKKVDSDCYTIENNTKNEIPDEVILYAILDSHKGATNINLSHDEINHNSISNIFALNKTGLYSKMESLSKHFPNIVFKDHAGIRELQFRQNYNHFEILEGYYAN